MKADVLLVHNIRAILIERRIDASELAFGVGHSQAWISKILSGERKMRLSDVEAVARYFGIEPYQLMAPGISRFTERRHRERRTGQDRRELPDRRKASVETGPSYQAAPHGYPPTARRPPSRPDGGAAPPAS